MKTVVLLAGLVALSLAGIVPQHKDVETKPGLVIMASHIMERPIYDAIYEPCNTFEFAVDADFVARQKKILSFFYKANQLDPEAEYYKIGSEYDIEANIDKYTDKKAVEEFLKFWRTGFTPKGEIFSVFYERMREESIALFHLFFNAKDFETFFKTAAFARVHLHAGQFYYAFYIALFHRPDTHGIIVPAPYEVFPEYFTNSDTIFKAYRIKMQDDIFEPEVAREYGIEKDGNHFVFYSNYSNYWTYDNEEQRLAYFTEDVGLNAYNYYFQTFFPYWMEGERWGVLKERRGEIYYYYYQQLLALYYMNRLSNGLGEIPDFSWYHPIKNGYTPFLAVNGYPFIQRNHYYQLRTEDHFEDLRFLDTYEKTFVQYLQRGHFKAYNQEVDFRSSKAINFVGNYWQANVDLYEKTDKRNFYRSYEMTARRLLSAAPHPLDKHTVAPSALNFYSTSLRDPVFYQLYSKILKYFLQYKEYLEPYTQDNLHFPGVKINSVEVSKLVTFYDFYEYDITNAVFDSKQELKDKSPVYKVRQPRLNHQPFTVAIDIKSDVETDAVIKVFLGPKYDSNGYPITLENDWMNFIELDYFKVKLTSGQNNILRSSDEFFLYKRDSLPIVEVAKLLEQGKVPVDMSQKYEYLPKRLMLPKGTDGGFPYQFFVFVYPWQALEKQYEDYEFLIDNKPFGYPMERPINEDYFKQPNMFFEDVSVYFEGEHFPYSMNNPFHKQNQVPKN